MNREAFSITLQPPNIQVETKPLRRPECKVKAQSVSVCLYFNSQEPLYSFSATEKCIISHSVSTMTTLDSDCPECGSLLVSEQSMCTSYLYHALSSRKAVQCVCVCMCVSLTLVSEALMSVHCLMFWLLVFGSHFLQAVSSYHHSPSSLQKTVTACWPA